MPRQIQLINSKGFRNTTNYTCNLFCILMTILKNADQKYFHRRHKNLCDQFGDRPNNQGSNIKLLTT